MTDWATFPSTTVDAGAPLYRIHREVDGAPWFNDTGDWRFDPPSSHRGRFGTCYLAYEPIGSYVEVFGRIGTVPRSEVDRRNLAAMLPTRPLTLADLTDRCALGKFHVTGEHSMSKNYGPAQELAAELYGAGFDGLHYRLRHDLGMTLEGVALFGDAGEHPERFDEIKSGDIPDALVADGEAFGITVLPASPLLS